MSIRVSEKHGVNPCMMLCYFCNQETGEIALLGRLKDDAEAPRKAVINQQPCDECKKHMAKGIVVISVRDGESGDNPWRTGGWWVIKEEGFKRMFGEDSELTQAVVKSRVCFVEDSTCKKLGLPYDNKAY